MATRWVLGKMSDALQPTVQSVISRALSLAGGAMNTAGSSINSSIRYHGDGAENYGSSITDWSKVPAARAHIASKLLGLDKTSAAGRASATSPRTYRAPSSKSTSASKTLPGQKYTLALVKSATVTSEMTRNSTANIPLDRKNVAVSNKSQPNITTKLASTTGSTGPKRTVSPVSRPRNATSAGTTHLQNKRSAAANH